MSTEPFPCDASRRRVIVVLSDEGIRRAEEEGKSEILYSDEIHVLTLPVQPNDTSPVLQNILDSIHVRPNTVLVQNPFDPDSYEIAEDGLHRFALEKHFYLSQLCGLLGATEVVVEQVDIRERGATNSVNTRVDVPKAGASVEYESEILARLRAETSLRDHFPGGPSQVEAAEQLLRRTRLWSDSNMRSLFELRRLETNQILSRRLTMSLTNEARSNLEIAAGLKGFKLLSLSAEFARVVEEHHDFTLTFTVNF